MRATARVDHTLCLGTGLCEAMAPGLFSLGDDGTATARPAGPGEDRGSLLDRLRAVADCCPAGAITVTTTEEE